MITQKDVPRDFQDIRDTSDNVLFECFATDLKIVCSAMGFRKKLQGIFDNDREKFFDEDVKPQNYATTEEYEEELVNQIEYVA